MAVPLSEFKKDRDIWDQRLTELKTGQVKGLSIEAFFREVRQR